MRNLLILLAAVSLFAVAVGCSSSSKGTTTPTGTATGTPTPIGSGTPITISVVATQESASSGPLAGVTVSIFQTGDTTALGTGTTLANGSASISAPTGGNYVEGTTTISGYMPTYFFPAAPFTANSSVALEMITTTTFGELSGLLAGVTQSNTSAFIGVEIVDAQGNPVNGATVTSVPAGLEVKYDRYSSLASGEAPSKTATTTTTDGVAFIFNVAPGTVSVSATAPGITFTPHNITATVGALNTTVATP